ncbi:recombinase family protein [Priestia megaterium]|uniref:recombinase family protein n=1 Tax=Priestia megaterium TaxID=1404 RepID=UPI000BFB669D|nr:recombinase family protein [Priestia megaterium]PGX80407.1 hypothetical protein COE31_04870 [Priestia megaterium]
MRLAFGYIRRSSYKQQENNSMEIQKQHIQEFAKRNQLNVPDDFIVIEDVTSAFSKRANQRKELMKLREKMIEMNVPIVIFHEVSRMDRTGYSFTIDFYRPLLESLPNLEVYTTQSNEPIDPDSMNLKMNFLLFQHESEVKSERALSNLKAELQQERPIRPGSTIPYGYTQIDKQLVPNKDAEIVSFISFLYSWGKSLKKIAFLLNEAGIPSPKGKQWRSSTIENILKNSVYTGDLTWNIPKIKDEKNVFIFKDSHESIVSDFHLHLHQYNKKVQATYGRLDTPFMFLNKLRCHHCHQAMFTQNGSTKRNGTTYEYHYYVCKHCQYKVCIQDVHKSLVPVILEHIQQLALSEQNQKSTLEILKQMKVKFEKTVLEINVTINTLSKKLKQAQEIIDRELELQILAMLNQNQNSLLEYEKVLISLDNYYRAVELNHFFTRFNEILEHQLDTSEKRLIILYFVDFILISTDQKPHIQYKNNIFDFLQPACSE